ncbi:MULTISPECIES: hypothetical protein [Cysteiniphilum]|uniref:Uncharacterized protein n=1 Tax=Cysteiniphilum litorale TaxID=2056700 RepID=A0A8J2Z2Z8_9GAMM|nr:MULTISPECIES: hypothetical protein [Cysteiniphilum]GGF93003.1 hypothetical protein GCM10010995_07690 [Cysteiniphilum litorale]
MLHEANNLANMLRERLTNYDAIVVGEDKQIYISGIVPVIHTANVKYMLPIYIAQTTIELAKLKIKLDKLGLRVIYILDNKYDIEQNEPTGQELIKLWHIENDSVLVTSSYIDIAQQNPPYPVFDKFMPLFDIV